LPPTSNPTSNGEEEEENEFEELPPTSNPTSNGEEEEEEEENEFEEIGDGELPHHGDPYGMPEHCQDWSDQDWCKYFKEEYEALGLYKKYGCLDDGSGPLDCQTINSGGDTDGYTGPIGGFQ
jgi:hypothetical protein